MTKAVDLAAASEGVATIAEAYKEPTDKVLDPEAIGESLLERMPAPTGWRILVLPYRGKAKQTEYLSSGCCCSGTDRFDTGWLRP